MDRFLYFKNGSDDGCDWNRVRIRKYGGKYSRIFAILRGHFCSDTVTDFDGSGYEFSIA